MKKQNEFLDVAKYYIINYNSKPWVLQVFFDSGHNGGGHQTDLKKINGPSKEDKITVRF